MNNSFQDYFLLHNPEAVLEVNRRVKAGKLTATYLTDKPFYLYSKTMEEERKAGKALFYDLIPMDWDGQPMSGFEDNQWHLVKTTPYIHPLTIPHLAKKVDSTEHWCLKVLTGQYILGENGLVTERPRHDFGEGFSVTRCLEQILTLKQKKISTLNIESIKHDFLWEFFPVPPALQFKFKEYPWGMGYLPYHRLLENLIRKLLYKMKGAYDYIKFYFELESWIYSAQQPAKESLWELTLSDNTLGATKRQSYLLPTIGPHDKSPKLSEEEQTIADNFNSREYQKVFLLPKQQFLRLEGDLLKLYQLPDFTAKQTIAMPQEGCHFYKKERQKLYFLNQEYEALYIFDTESMSFEENPKKEKHSYLEFFESLEVAFLYSSAYNFSLRLTDLGDYPIVNVFDYSKRYFWCLDKESNGGVYDVNRCMLVRYTNDQNWNVYGKIRIFQKDGSFIDQNFEEEEGNSPYDLLSETERAETEDPSLLEKGDSFGLLGDDFLFFFGQALFYKEQLLALFDMGAIYTEYCPETGLLYLENEEQIQIFDVSEPQKEIRLIVNKEK